MAFARKILVVNGLLGKRRVVSQCKQRQIMQSIFSSSELLKRDKGLTYDDVLLVPRFSQISSRRIPTLETSLTKKKKMSIPLISSNMDTITEKDMAKAMGDQGGLGIIHRFMTVEEQIRQVLEVKKASRHSQDYYVSASIGVKEEGKKRAAQLVDAGVDILTVDIAHGDSMLMLEMLDYIKKTWSDVEVIAGNVATDHGVRRLVEAGADAIKVGIGPGSMCTTRIITGCGVPQLSAIALAYEEANRFGVPIIADGGLKSSGDIVKAFCAGASSVMLGKMLSGTLETPGIVQSGKKKYRGMASKEAQVSWRGELPEGMAPEGESMFVHCKGSVKDVLYEITGGIKSAMSYINSKTLPELRENASFIEITPSTLKESRPHGLGV